MLQVDGHFYDPETIEVLRTALEEAWESLSARRQAALSKTDLAERILALASTGERDPMRLRAAALNGISAGNP